MSVRLLPARFVSIDGSAIEDYESLPNGTITFLPQLIGNGGCELEVGMFVQI